MLGACVATVEDWDQAMGFWSAEVTNAGLEHFDVHALMAGTGAYIDWSPARRDALVSRLAGCLLPAPGVLKYGIWHRFRDEARPSLEDVWRLLSSPF